MVPKPITNSTATHRHGSGHFRHFVVSLWDTGQKIDPSIMVCNLGQYVPQRLTNFVVNVPGNVQGVIKVSEFTQKKPDHP